MIDRAKRSPDVAAAYRDYERYGDSSEALVNAIRDPETSAVFRGIARMELVSRKAAGDDIPAEWLDL